MASDAAIAARIVDVRCNYNLVAHANFQIADKLMMLGRLNEAALRL